MKIKRCHIENFTVFEKQDLEFCGGVNVIIGTNGTGKSHLLKVLYSFATHIQNFVQEGESYVSPLLEDVFKTERRIHEDIIGSKEEWAYIEVTTDVWDSAAKLLKGTRAIETAPSTGLSTVPSSVIFIPPSDVLAIYPGFTASYEKRELGFDRTYYDICKALSANPLKKKSEAMDKLVAELEKILRGKVICKGDHFYVRNTDTGKELEAHLLAEGHRKIAALVHLINNGSIEEGTVLFWDEPEVNLNPKLIKSVADALRALADAGVQVFVTTHDYLLSSELSLAAEYKTAPTVPIRFFGMSREGDEPVSVQSGDTLAALSNNPILEEFAAHYDREQDLFYSEAKAGSAHE